MFPASWKAMLTPRVFYQTLDPYLTVLLIFGVLTVFVGCFSGLFLVPADYQQGDAFRILYLHVPLAALSMGLYAFMVVASIAVYVWQLKLYDQLAYAAASVGALYTVLTLITGSVWGKPMWGTWWLWDVRLTSELILLFFYSSVLLIRAHVSDRKKAAKTAAIVCFLGSINLPIIHFSVEWWHSLHQKSSILGLHAPTIDASMLWPLALMFAGLITLTSWLMLTHAKGTFKQQQKEGV